jgi:hypothetical protein
LSNYKFKDWAVTETRKQPVTQEMRERRAKEVAERLMDQEWHSHGRPIGMAVLRKDLNLRIHDFGEDPDLSQRIKEYYQFLADYMGKLGAYGVVHTKGICLKWA